MASETERIARLLEKTFDKHPWFGNSIIETLSGLHPEIATSHHGPTHSILELLVHMTSWRTFVTRRLQGEDSYEVSEDMNFPKPGSWQSAMDELRESQNKLLEAIRNFPEERLGELVPHVSHKYTYYTLMHGVVQHDIYHLGQIAYIKKSFS